MDVVTYALCKKLAKSAVSGIKNLTVSGLDLIIETNDGNQFIMTFPKPADGLDGKDGNSVVNIQIDNQNHLICTISDGTTIDAGEIVSAGGGLVQNDELSQFPEVGREDTLYLSKDTGKLYYWDGSAYIATKSGEGGSDCGCEEPEYATNEDIDKLFNDIPSVDLSGYDFATNEDIDNLFDDIPDTDISKYDFATKEDINNLF